MRSELVTRAGWRTLSGQRMRRFKVVPFRSHAAIPIDSRFLRFPKSTWCSAFPIHHHSHYIIPAFPFDQILFHFVATSALRILDRTSMLPSETSDTSCTVRPLRLA